MHWVRGDSIRAGRHEEKTERTQKATGDNKRLVRKSFTWCCACSSRGGGGGGGQSDGIMCWWRGHIKAHLGPSRLTDWLMVPWYPSMTSTWMHTHYLWSFAFALCFKYELSKQLFGGLQLQCGGHSVRLWPVIWDLNHNDDIFIAFRSRYTIPATSLTAVDHWGLTA